VVNVAEAIIQNHGGTVTPLLSFDSGVIHSLYLVALKCPVRRLRYKAIEILKRTPEQEGLWRRETIVRHAARHHQGDKLGRGGCFID
jgi:hypothetical protein